MSCDVFPKPIKSRIWLGFIPFNIPLRLFTATELAGAHQDSIKFDIVDDEFELYVVNNNDSLIRIAIYRNRLNPNEKPDDGYALRFYITVTGFDEKTQVATLMHDQEKAQPIAIYKITNEILEKANKTHHVFDIFIVVEMIEFKSLDVNHVGKRLVDGFMSRTKRALTKEEIRYLGFILKSPKLKDTFTGRLPVEYMCTVQIIISMITKELPKVYRYLHARYQNKKLENLHINEILKCVGLEHKKIVNVEAVTEYYVVAHRIGLDCYKVIMKDYLETILDKGLNVMYILDVAIMVNDQDLFQKAVVHFLSRFHEIIRSATFEFYSNKRGLAARVILHAVRIWVTENDVEDIPWGEPKIPTTEL